MRMTTIGRRAAPSGAARKGELVDVTTILFYLIVGTIVGLLGKFLAPGDKDNIPLWLTIICGIGGMLIGDVIYRGLRRRRLRRPRLGPQDRHRHHSTVLVVIARRDRRRRSARARPPASTRTASDAAREGPRTAGAGPFVMRAGQESRPSSSIRCGVPLGDPAEHPARSRRGRGPGGRPRPPAGRSARRARRPRAAPG